MEQEPRKRRSVAALFVAAALVVGCEENPPDTIISQFDRPQDVAIICYDGDAGKTLPLECCRAEGVQPGGACAVGLPSARLYAFVTQTTPGEVAVVDLEAQSIVDQDTRVPYNSFIPVGGQPSDIAATSDGKRVYTANYETGDLSVIAVESEDGTVSIIDRPSLKPAISIPLGEPIGPAAKLAIAKFPESLKDRFAFVTQPTLGRLAVVALDGQSCPDREENENGCLLGYLSLDYATIGAPEPEETRGQPGNIRPWAIAASERTPSLFVGGTDGPYVVEIDGQILINEALSLATPSALSDRAIVRPAIRLAADNTDYTTRSLSLEPGLERWLYAVENEEGGLLPIDLVNREIGKERDARGNYRTIHVDVPGRARSVMLLRLGEVDEASPLTFNGTFAVVSTTMAGVYVVDVEDLNADPIYPHPHSLRSDTNLLSSDAGDLPQIADEPQLFVDGTEMAGNKARAFAHIVGASEEEDAGPDALDGGVADAGGSADGGQGGALPACTPDPDAGVLYRPDDSFGFRFRCDPRESQREDWRLTWQGSIGVSGAGVILFGESDVDHGEMVIEDTAIDDFCKKGIREKSDVYGGDLLVITTAPTPVGDADAALCMAVYGNTTLVYQIIEVMEPQKIRFANYPLTYPSPLPRVECFGQAVGYEVKAFDHWVLMGSRSGHLVQGEFEADGGVCAAEVPFDPHDTQTFLRQRVYAGRSFANKYFTFLLEQGPFMDRIGIEKPRIDGSGQPIPQEVFFQFSTMGGFEPLNAVLGNNITDFEFTPDEDLLAVDQDELGLIVFDMIDTFSPRGEAIN